MVVGVSATTSDWVVGVVDTSSIVAGAGSITVFCTAGVVGAGSITVFCTAGVVVAGGDSVVVVAGVLEGISILISFCGTTAVNCCTRLDIVVRSIGSSALLLPALLADGFGYTASAHDASCSGTRRDVVLRTSDSSETVTKNCSAPAGRLASKTAYARLGFMTLRYVLAGIWAVTSTPYDVASFACTFTCS